MIKIIYRLQSKQWLAGLAASLAMINVGSEEFWLITNLKNLTNFNPASLNKKSYLWAGLLLAATSSIFGTFLGALLSEKLGRKKTLLATAIFAISQILASLTANSILSCVSLFIGITGSGITRVVVPLYVSEIVDDNIRGALLMLQLPFFYIGKLMAIGIGNLVSTEIFGIVLLILTIIFFLTFTLFPETPEYLASNNKNKIAKQSMTFYKGIKNITGEEQEIEVIIKNVEVKNNNNNIKGCYKTIRELLQPTNRKGLLIIIFLIIIKWSERIFHSRDNLTHVILLTGTLVSNENEAKFISHITCLVTTLFILFTVDTIGRRSLLLYSSLIGFILIIIIFISNVRDNYTWIYYVIDVTLHFCELIIFSVLSIYNAELFTKNIKPMGIAIVTTFNLLTSFVIIILMEFMAMDYNSIIGDILFLFAFPIIFAFIPETKKKSYSDIQNELTITFHSKWMRKKFHLCVNRSQ